MTRTRKAKSISRTIVFASLLSSHSWAQSGEPRTDWKFIFGDGQMPAGWTRVLPADHYREETGFGFEPVASVVTGSNCVTSASPFLFSVKLPEGNYRLTLRLGDHGSAATNTVKAELRRLMLENIVTPKGGLGVYGVTVNLRTSKLPGGGEVRLKPRERESEIVNWDDKLTLEFNGDHPCIHSLVIAPVEVPTIFLLGDSTVCDQPREPWNSWGQMLPRFFKPSISVANHAESGEAIKSSFGARRFEKVFSLMKTNDWLFVQFGHNDMKDRATNALGDYKTNLKKIVALTRAKGGTPVLVTSMERKGVVGQNTLGGYPDAVRQVANEEFATLIDLNAMSKVFYKALGTGIGAAFEDGTHHNNYGSYELARCVVEGIRRNMPALAKFLVDDVPPFDPAHPDSPDTFRMAISPIRSELKPDGN